MMSPAYVLAAITLVNAIATKASADEPMPKDAPYVEIDFSSLPNDGMGRYKMRVNFETTDKDLSFSESFDYDRAIHKPDSICSVMQVFLRENRWKAKVVEKTKLRVYGRVFNDKLVPITKGSVDSTDLLLGEQPKVKIVTPKG